MAKYETLDLLNAGIERLVKRTTKHYYTDWKHHDRPHYMFETAKGENHFVLIVRTCGTYLFSKSDMERNNPKMICEYYHEQENGSAWFYEIDRSNMKLVKMPEQAIKDLYKGREKAQ